MRLLFTFVGGRGHFEPLAPIARAQAIHGRDATIGVVEQAAMPADPDRGA